jgi:choline-glycine betaine transporter
MTEWQIQRLKLFSGIMIFTFGLFFIIDYMLLENVLIAIGLPCVSIFLTVCISYVWKKYKKEPEVKPDEEPPSEEKV